MKRLTRVLMLALPLALAACGQSTSASAGGQVASAASIPAIQEPSIQAARQFAKGFDVGNLMSARQVYVFFDPQCPHCGAFWQETKALEKDARFTWVPVAVLNRASMSQGAAILSSAKPVDTMNEHEAKLMARTGGIAAPDADQNFKAIIEKNTRLLESFGATGVPFVLSVDSRTGKVFTSSGGLPAAELAAKLGWTPAPEAATPVAGVPVAVQPPAK
ncbi:thioredoxin fold domain-containing protein [Burkholderia ubonensis]|uniref:thioredoxin fold domain-containing protein n=1 Tax=Burkholderia ubonensis TaxID=101571 RepID=UPI0007C7F73E|nr:thioredoxin fold domain-containing protein [Burkholderia ubonensis]